jgi:hypothetical protein
MHNVLLNQARQTYLSDSDRQPGILTSGTLYLNDAYLEASEEFFKKKTRPLWKLAVAEQ